jgi:glycosyltransferase involved in cell wall biosynthesis
MRVFGNLFFACTREAGVWLFGKVVMKKNNFYTIKNAIDLNKFVYNPDMRLSLREKLNITKNFTISMVGRLTQVKNHAFALEVFAQLCKKEPAAVFYMIGDGELKNSIQNKAMLLGIIDKVVFTGAVENIYDYFQALDVLLLPSFHEGFPVAAVEAQAAGLPVFLSDTLASEIACTPLAQFLSLEDGAEAWAAEILKVKDFPRQTQDLSATGHDITHAAQVFKNILQRD